METNFAVVNKYLGGGVVQAISARELHTFLESKQDFSTWVKKRLEDCCALEEQDYTRVHKKMEANNANVIEYFVSLDMAQHLAMIERNARGFAARQWFIDYVKHTRAQMVAIPQDLPSALRLAAAEAEKRQLLESELAVVAPKAEALDRISQADGDLCITDAAKTLGMKRTELFDWLSSHEWIYKRPNGSAWIAHQPKLNSGYLRHIERRYNNGEGGFNVTTQVVVTPKGLARLAQLHLKEVA